MDPYEKDKAQVMAMFYGGIKHAAIRAFYEGHGREAMLDTVLMQLSSEGMVKREEGSYAITRKGIEVFQRYGNYQKYAEARSRQWEREEKDKKLDLEVKKSTVLSNYLNSVNVACGIAGFIAGVLLSDPVKWILSWLLSLF